ncbi:MAG TPA: GerMN domain-containing protein [Terriglobia bacterium]|nr:GerMN domain-containing protein [Terriglobia bacterium]
MPRHIKIGLIILGISGAIAMGFFVDIVGRVRSLVNERETEENPFKPPTQPLYAPTDPAIMVKIFFPAATGDTLLVAADQTIFKSAEVGNRARQILQKLQEDPQVDTLLPPLPKDTKVQDIFISEQGTAFIDFSNAIATGHPGGVLNELATIYSIVDSLTYNLPEIKQVKILVGGVEKETLAGHCLLLLPLEMDLSITNVMPREEKIATLPRSASALASSLKE